MSTRPDRLRPDGGTGGRRRLAMSNVVLDVSISLDGFVAGPNVRDAVPMA